MAQNGNQLIDAKIKQALLADKQIQQKIDVNKNNPSFNVDAFLFEVSQCKTDNSGNTKQSNNNVALSSPTPPFGCSPTTTAYSNTNPVTIPNTAPPIVLTSTIVVAGAGPYLWDLDLITNIVHTFGADLDITIQSPAGTIVTITTDNAGANDNTFNGTTWDDDANPLGQVPYTANNGLVTDHTYTNLVLATPLVPEEPLGAFIGENPNGTWTLTLSDDATGDGGTLTWGMSLTTLPASPTIIPATTFNNLINTPLTDNAVTTSTIVVSGLGNYIADVDILTRISHTFSADLDITITSPSGTVVTLTTDNGAGNDDVYSATTWNDDANPSGQLPYTSMNGICTDHLYVNFLPASPLTPEEALSAFIGENPNGTWTLRVSDDLTGNTGSLANWNLYIATAAPCCSNTTNSISPTVCGTYTVPSGDETYTSSGTYMDTIPNSTGCDSILTINLTVNPLPIFNITGNTSFCFWDSTLLTGPNNGASYQWFLSNFAILGATNNTYYASAGGNYQLQMTNSNGCSNLSTNTININVNPLPTVSLGADITQCGGTATLDAQNAGSMYMWSDASTTQTITVNSTGNYSVVVTDVNGCSNSDTISVTINAVPVVALGIDTAVCVGITLDAQNAGSMYMWSDNSIAQMLMVTSTDTYSVTVTNTSGCSNADTIMVTVNPLPALAYNETQTLVCVNWSAITLTAGTPANGTYSGTAVTGNMFDPATAGAGTFAIVYTFTDINGCSNSDTSMITVDLCTGINNSNELTQLAIYPNPSAGVFTINASSEIEMLIVTDVVGKEIARINPAAAMIDLNLSHLANGIYNVQVLSNNNTTVKQIVINK